MKLWAVDQPEIISQLKALELHFEEGRQRAYSIRILLEQVSAPAPSGAEMTPTKAKLKEMINKRKKTFYKSRSVKPGTRLGAT